VGIWFFVSEVILLGHTISAISIATCKPLKLPCIMMLQSNSIQSHSSAWVPFASLYEPPALQKETSEQLVEQSEVEGLMERLVPDDVSPVKRAVIERLVTGWLLERRHTLA
jgi:hypothetical protein